MNTIVVSYFELTNDASGVSSPRLIGSEVLNDIDEALIPTKENFFIKKFSNINHYIWHVEDVHAESSTSTTPTVFTISLRREISSLPIEFLQQTIKKGPIRSPNRILWPGTLVEIDFGFVQGAGHIDGQIKSNKRYSDTLQAGEMRKRRLAVVVKTFPNRVQVVPVTCAEPSINDKSAFQLSANTLNDLCFYGSSGKDSWVLCSMLETVSIRRILPPATYFHERGIRKSGRSTKYYKKLSTDEMQFMRSALMHSIGVIDYDLLKVRLEEQTVELARRQAIEDDLSTLQRKYDDLLKENKELELIKEIAMSWEKYLGENLIQTQVQELRDLYQEIQSQQ